MNVTIKTFNVAMEVKNAGIELEIRDTANNFLGDLIITKTSLIWCEGRTRRQTGTSAALLEQRRVDSRNYGPRWL